MAAPSNAEIEAATRALAAALAGPQGTGFPVGHPQPGTPMTTSGVPAPFSGLTVTGVTTDSMLAALEPVLAVDPARLLAEADRLARAQAPIENPPTPASEALTEAVGEARRRLEGWQGEGADAFRRQVERMSSFTEGQSKAIVEVAATTLAAHQVAVLARRDVLALTLSATASLGVIADQQAVQDTKAVLYLAGGVAATVVGAITTPGLLMATLMAGGTAISAGTTVVTTELAAATPDDVAANYVAARDRVLRTLDEEMAFVHGRVDGIGAEYRPQPRLLEPLPSSTDVHAVDFGYPDMNSEWQASPTFADAVRREAAVPTAPAGPPGPIGRALG